MRRLVHAGPAAAVVLAVAVADSTPARAQLQVINMIPNAMSSESNRDSEPSVAVSPANPLLMTGVAFMPTPSGSPNGPLLVSTDGGSTWVARNVIPSSPGSTFNTGDITLRFNSAGTAFYIGILRAGTGNLEVARTPDVTFATPMVVLESRGGPDQPYISARTVTGWFDAGLDRVWVSTNDVSRGAASATIDQCLDAAATTPAFSQITIDADSPVGRDSYQTRPIAAADGHVYAAFYRRKGSTANGYNVDVVVVREDDWGKTTPPFVNLVDSTTAIAGENVVVNTPVSDTFDSSSTLGGEWWGGDLFITVDPRDASRVYLSYQDSQTGTDRTLHLRRSTDFGQSWGADLLTVPAAKNSAVAVNMQGKIAYAYQTLTSATPPHWQTHLRRSTDGTTWDDVTLNDFPASGTGAPPSPYRIVGDYMNMVSVGKNFYGVFSAYNDLTSSTFPAGITWQRNRSGTNLLGTDGVSVVTPSVDPFFYRSVEMDPSVDFYVRDWTDSAATRDHGQEPSVRADFFSTSDVWNRRSDNPLPFDGNDRPQSEDPQPAAMGTNFAFTRVSRETTGAAADVTLQYLFSDGGVGVNYVSAGAPTTLHLNAGDTQQTPAAGAGFEWTLPSGESNHVCLAVEISTAADPVTAPSLLGRAPGWPTTDLLVVNDNNKAQRNLQVYGFSAPSPAEMAMYADVHNAATVTRDMLIGIAVDSADLARLTGARLTAIGSEDSATVKPGDVLTLHSMAPGEHRWVELAFNATASAGGEMPIEIVELKNGQVINGYAFVPTEELLGDAIRDTLNQHAAVFHRLADAFEIPGAREQAKRAQLALHLSALHRGKARAAAYARFVKNNADEIAGLVDTFVGQADGFDPFGLRAAAKRLSNPNLSPADAQTLHLTLLTRFDASQSQRIKSQGDVADIPQVVRWQGEIFRRLFAKHTVWSTDVSDKSAAFLSRFEARKVGIEGFGPLLASVRQGLEAAAAHDPTGNARQALAGIAPGKSPAQLQKAHRSLLAALDPMSR